MFFQQVDAMFTQNVWPNMFAAIFTFLLRIVLRYFFASYVVASGTTPGVKEKSEDQEDWALLINKPVRPYDMWMSVLCCSSGGPSRMQMR